MVVATVETRTGTKHSLIAFGFTTLSAGTTLATSAAFAKTLDGSWFGSVRFWYGPHGEITQIIVYFGYYRCAIVELEVVAGFG